MSCLNPEGERSLSRQVSTDEAERAGIWTRVGSIMMMYMAWPAVQGRRRINLTAEASRSMDGWKGTQGLNKRPPRRAKKAPQLQPWSFYYTHAGQKLQRWTPPPLWSTEYKVQPHTKSQTSAHTSTRAHNLTSCRGATKVQPTYSPSTTTHKALSLLLDRLTLQDPRQQTTVGRAEIFCLGRLHLHRARPRRPLSLISDDTRPAASASASAASAALSSQPPLLLIISLSVWQSVCLVCVCSVPRSTQPSPLFHPPLAESRGQAGRPHSRC